MAEADIDGVEMPDVRRARALNKTITMAEIARATKVSQGAISSLLNDRDYGIRVSAKTREKVFRVCRELGYVPNDLRALVRMYPEMGMFALLVSAEAGCIMENPLYCRILKGAVSALSEFSQSISLGKFEVGVDYSTRADLLPQPVQNGAASKFLCIGTPNFSLFDVIKKRDLPVAVLNDDLSAPGVLSVVPDYAEAAMNAMEHLFTLGHRHIGILAGPFGSTEHRIADLTHGVRLAFENRGKQLRADNVAHGDLTFESGANSLGHLLDNSPAPTAVFCFDDRIAAGAMACARDRGLDVPRDLSIIGCGDYEFAAYLSPALTTVHLPAKEVGASAVRAIEDLVRANKQPTQGKIALPARLVERATSAPPKQ
jgi:DNA-binding LacI/PurR family transcriptional regulator